MAGDVLEVAAPERTLTDLGPTGPGPAPRGSVAAFFLWGSAAYLIATFGVLARALGRTDGRMVYVIDDAAIHLSVARNLADHGTWGVVPGHFESASSSPLWTVVLAAWLRISPGPDSVAPLLLNVAASLAVIGVFAVARPVLRPALRRPLDLLATVGLVTIVLFLPGLTFTGMEHNLHVALLVAAVALFHRRVTREPTWGPAWLPFLLLALATLTRFETGFVAVGLAIAFLVTGSGGAWWPPSAARWRTPVLVLVVSAGSFAAFAAVNLVMGQGLLPNSVLAKGTRPSSGVGQLEAAFDRFGEDPLVALLAAVAVVVVVVVAASGRARPEWTFPAVVVVVAVALHMVFAQVGWYERYQSYLIALGAYLVLCLVAALPGSEGPAGTATAPGRGRPWAAPALVCLLVLFTGNKPAGVLRAGEAMDDTYDQRYQAALFLARYYEGEPVATGELGYISLFHEGPITDVFGLGDNEVLEQWQSTDGRPPADYWAQLMDERGVDVVAVYPLTLYKVVPETWIPVGRIDVGRFVSTAPGPELHFYATRPEAVARLHDALEDFATDLPEGSEIELNPLAEMKADAVLRAAEGVAPGPPGEG